jgi:hypothetical protein
VSDHYHYEYADARHDHRAEYADERHDHDLDYAEKHHRHYDDERAVDELRRELRQLREVLNEYERDLADARARIRALESDTPQARQLQYEADLAAADLAESGYQFDDYGPPVAADRHGRDCRCPFCFYDPEEEPLVAEHDPGPEVDDEGGMSEYRYVLLEDYERGQS